MPRSSRGRQPYPAEGAAFQRAVHPDPREEKVLRLRFGLEDGRPRTLEEVGHEFR